MLPFGRTVDEAEPLRFELLGELSAADVRMASETPLGTKAPPIRELKARHHAIARALAEGMRPGVVAATYGYSPSRISILQSDPTFQELLAHYKSEMAFDNARTRERLQNLGIDAMDEISRRLEEAPEEIGINALIRLTEIVADRTGHGKKSETDVNVNIGFADRLRQARERIAAIPGPKIIEGEIV